MNGTTKINGRDTRVGFALATLVMLGACLPDEGGGSAMTTTTESSGEAPPTVVVSVGPETLALVEIARGSDEAELRTLGKQLDDDAFLNSLNTEFEYASFKPEQLQLHFILSALLANDNAAARAVADGLLEASRYRYAGATQAALLSSSVAAINPTPALQGFWRRELAPDGAELTRVVDVLLTNGSAGAMGVLQQALLDNDYHEGMVITWFHDSLLRNRQAPQVLASSQRLLENDAWPKTLKQALTESLFEYEPDTWYFEETPPKPPARSDLNAETRAQLQLVLDLAAEQGLVTRSRARALRDELGI